MSEHSNYINTWHLARPTPRPRPHTRARARVAERRATRERRFSPSFSARVFTRARDRTRSTSRASVAREVLGLQRHDDDDDSRRAAALPPLGHGARPKPSLCDAKRFTPSLLRLKMVAVCLGAAIMAVLAVWA